MLICGFCLFQSWRILYFEVSDNKKTHLISRLVIIGRDLLYGRNGCISNFVLLRGLHSFRSLILIISDFCLLQSWKILYFEVSDNEIRQYKDTYGFDFIQLEASDN